MKLIETFATRFSAGDMAGIQFAEKKMDTVVILDGRHSLHGLVLGDEALLLDDHSRMSFRVKSGNLGFWKKSMIAKLPQTLDKDMLRLYFEENRDNPYAIQHVLSCLMRGDPLNHLTQYPPLFVPQPNRRERIEKLAALCAVLREGDGVFSGQYRTPISSSIRWFDRGQFSHVGTYMGNGMVADLGPDGLHESSLREYPESTSIAGYTFFDDITDEQRRQMVDFNRRGMTRGVKYSYVKLFLLFLRKRFRVSIATQIPTVSELLYANRLRLVGYL